MPTSDKNNQPCDNGAEQPESTNSDVLPEGVSASAVPLGQHTERPKVRNRTRPVPAASGENTGSAPKDPTPNDAPTTKTADVAAGRAVAASENEGTPHPAKKAIAEKAVSKTTQSYAIGYKKPDPRWSFKPGQSGNPKGRPKALKGVEQILAEELAVKMNVKIDGKVKRVSRLEVGISQMMKSFVAGDKKAFAIVLTMMGYATSGSAARKSGDAPPDTSTPPPIDANGLKMLATHQRELLVQQGLSESVIESILVSMGLSEAEGDGDD